MSVTKAHVFNDTVRLEAPEGSENVNHGGFDFPVEDGHVVVPRDAAELLNSHGFKVAKIQNPEDIKKVVKALKSKDQ